MGAWHGGIIPLYGIHPYYTLFFIKIQVKLAKTRFFVNYDNYLCQHHYVNLTQFAEEPFTIFNYNDNI